RLGVRRRHDHARRGEQAEDEDEQAGEADEAGRGHALLCRGRVGKHRFSRVFADGAAGGPASPSPQFVACKSGSEVTNGAAKEGIDAMMDDSHRLPLDRPAWRRWGRVVLSFARSPQAGRRAKGLLAALLVLLLAVNGLNVLNSYVGRDFMTAIEQ